jgi:hypothetical protein
MDRQIQTTGPRLTKAKKKNTHIYMCKKKREKNKAKKKD